MKPIPPAVSATERRPTEPRPTEPRPTGPHPAGPHPAGPHSGASVPATPPRRRVDVGPLMQAQRILITTHLGPDGDGIGSEMALQRGLAKAGKQALVLNTDPLPERYRFLDPRGVIRLASEEMASTIEAADLLVLVDTNDRERVGAPFHHRGDRPLCVIDHHLGEVPPGAHMICDPECSSTGELVYEVLLEMGVAIDRGIAEPIYASILYDTGSFRFIRNRPQTLRVAADLLELGVDAVGLQEHIFMSKPRDLPVLLSRVFERAVYEVGGRIVWATIEESDVADLHLDQDDLREVIMLLGSLQGVDVAFVLKATAPGAYKLSIRSRRTVNVFDVAARRGGGGHAHAAGAPVRGLPSEIGSEIVAELRELLP